MAHDLKTIVCKINVHNGCFRTAMDRDYAKQLIERHSLQSMLENVSGFFGDNTPKLTKELADHYISVLTLLIDNSSADWISTFIYGFNHPETFSLCVRSLRTVCKLAESKTFAGRDYTVYEESDFEGISNKAVLVLNLLQTLLKKIVSFGRSKKELDHWRSLLQVCYVSIHLLSQHIETNLWTSNQSHECAKECLQLLLEEFCCSSVCKLLTLDTKYILPSVQRDSDYNSAVKKSIFGKLLLYWKPYLERSTWKVNPMMVGSFSWCLMQMELPYLSHFIELVLPPVLLFIDDHTLLSKENGTRCLIHILKNTGAEELRWYGRAEVIYSALKLQLLSTEESLLPLTHEAILLILKVLEKNADDLGATTKYDEIFATILQAASHENKLALRRVHTMPLHIFIEQLGINSVKFTTNLLEIFEEYLEVSDSPSEKARINILHAMKSFIKVCYPRIHAHCTALLRMLVKLLHQVTRKKMCITESVENELLSEGKQCIELLKIVDEQNVSQTLVALKQLPFEEECKDIFDTFLAEPTNLDG